MQTRQRARTKVVQRVAQLERPTLAPTVTPVVPQPRWNAAQREIGVERTLPGRRTTRLAPTHETTSKTKESKLRGFEHSQSATVQTEERTSFRPKASNEVAQRQEHLAQSEAEEDSLENMSEDSTRHGSDVLSPQDTSCQTFSQSEVSSSLDKSVTLSEDLTEPSALASPVEQAKRVSVISAFIKRFREQPPTPRENRVCVDRDLFWWKPLPHLPSTEKSPLPLLPPPRVTPRPVSVEEIDSKADMLLKKCEALLRTLEDTPEAPLHFQRTQPFVGFTVSNPNLSDFHSDIERCLDIDTVSVLKGVAPEAASVTDSRQYFDSPGVNEEALDELIRKKFREQMLNSGAATEESGVSNDPPSLANSPVVNESQNQKHEESNAIMERNERGSDFPTPPKLLDLSKAPEEKSITIEIPRSPASGDPDSTSKALLGNYSTITRQPAAVALKPTMSLLAAAGNDHQSPAQAPPSSTLRNFVSSTAEETVEATNGTINDTQALHLPTAEAALSLVLPSKLQARANESAQEPGRNLCDAQPQRNAQENEDLPVVSSAVREMTFDDPSCEPKSGQPRKASRDGDTGTTDALSTRSAHAPDPHTYASYLGERGYSEDSATSTLFGYLSSDTESVSALDDGINADLEQPFGGPERMNFEEEYVQLEFEQGDGVSVVRSTSECADKQECDSASEEHEEYHSTHHDLRLWENASATSMTDELDLSASVLDSGDRNIAQQAEIAQHVTHEMVQPYLDDEVVGLLWARLQKLRAAWQKTQHVCS